LPRAAVSAGRIAERVAETVGRESLGALQSMGFESQKFCPGQMTLIVSVRLQIGSPSPQSEIDGHRAGDARVALVEDIDAPGCSDAVVRGEIIEIDREDWAASVVPSTGLTNHPPGTAVAVGVTSA
jgi:hypothetical protein